MSDSTEGQAPAPTPASKRPKARSVENGRATGRDTRFKPGNPGRRKGTPNKATKEIRVKVSP